MLVQRMIEFLEKMPKDNEVEVYDVGEDISLRIKEIIEDDNMVTIKVREY